jgi:O-antigen/teichoic acid export membrane protein
VGDILELFPGAGEILIGDTGLPEVSSTAERPALFGGSFASAITRLAAGLLSPTARKGVLALVDQAVVSGTSFLTTIIIGRFCGAEDLGVFSLGYGWVVVLAGVQQSFVLSPYIVFSNRVKPRSLAVYSGSALVQQGSLSLLGAVLLATGAAACWLGAFDPRLAAVLIALAFVIPLLSLRDFVRRMMIAHLKISSVLAFDAAVATLQMGALLALTLAGMLSAESACGVLGIACGAPAVLWFVATKRKFIVRRRPALRYARLHWSFGRWMCASQLTDIGQRYALFWLLAVLMGTAMTGVFVACASVVMIFSPIILGLGSVLAPRAAQAYSEGGGAEVKRVVWKTTVLLGLTMAVACAVLAACGELSLKLFYGGHEYSGYGAVVALLSLSTFLSAISFPADNGLWVMGRPDLNFWAGLWGLVVTLVGSALFVPSWGILGAALGGALGHAAASMIQIFAFFQLCRSQPRTNPE